MFRLMLLCDYTREPERRLLKGLSDFAATTGGWAYFQIPPQIYTHPERRYEISAKARELGADAIFGRWAGVDGEIARELGIPIVLRTGSTDYPDFPMLGGEYHDIGRLAADFFLSRHFIHYAFFGYKDLIWSTERAEGFCDRLREADFDAEVFETELGGDHDDTDIKAWLRSLPHPVALFAANDVLALHIAEICQELGILIPDELSLLGVDNDEFLCNIAYPPISSIHLNFEKQGYQLGQTLYEMRQQKRVWPARILVEPLHVQERKSTLRHNISDPYIRAIVDKIDRLYLTNISLAEITADIPLGRRSIELKFKQAMAPYTMLSYLTGLRIDHMCHLLRTTDLPVSLAAEKSGFDDPLNVGRTFKRYKGVSPVQYREQAKFSGPPDYGDAGHKQERSQ